MNDTTNKLRITGLKEPVVWIKDDKDNKPIAWMAGVGIAGLIPDPFKGYKFRYSRELISSDGQIVNTGILSQAPGYMGTSTTVAIGGRDLPAGNYTVRIRRDNDEEDTMAIVVPEYETWVAQMKQEANQKAAQTKPEEESIKRESDMNNKLEFVNEVYLEEDADSILVTVERKDHTKHSVVLREPTEALDISHISIDDATIDKIKDSLAIWGKKANNFADKYIKDHRQEIEFSNDIVTLCRCLAKLPDKLSSILKLGAATDLLHSRIMAQIMLEYHALGFEITLPTRKKVAEKIHDFDITGYSFKYKCEVKTIQSFGDIERFGQTAPIRTGGYRLTKQSHKSFIATIKDDFEDAMKVGENGITIVAPWSYTINALLREYFKGRLLPYPIIPSPNTTILVLTSDHVFQDYYVSFPTHLAFCTLEGAFRNIQSVGISQLQLRPIRRGLTHRTTLTRKDGTSAGLSIYNMSLDQE